MNCSSREIFIWLLKFVDGIQWSNGNKCQIWGLGLVNSPTSGHLFKQDHALEEIDLRSLFLIENIDIFEDVSLVSLVIFSFKSRILNDIVINLSHIFVL